ncbi:sigma-70 family RNA polymerase sigma factor [Aeromicrobium sp. CTD01-1L150]|uniref:sigma-70 family RNA polymerase sigma factor n=1 Tax=Aeromicrobium sp. CTD01-1L150 TaxID=3341830 RepID=UPI0035BF90DF
MPHLLADLLREPVLSADQELALSRAARLGDDAARQELVRASLRLVAMRVRAMGFGPGEIDDALQEGVVALMAAVDRFDPDRGVRLATFAWPRIGGALARWRTADDRTFSTDPLALPEVPEVGEEPSLAPAVVPLVEALPREEAVVLKARLGPLGGTGSRSWEDVGRDLGISASTARRRGDRAMSRIRRRLGRVSDRAPRAGADPP